MSSRCHLPYPWGRVRRQAATGWPPREVRVRKIVVGGMAAALGLSAVLAAGAFAGGNGAQRSGLSPTAGSSGDQCQRGTGAATNGFVMLNAPGKPGAAKKLLGEVSLKNGSPNTTYMVFVAKDDG